MNASPSADPKKGDSLSLGAFSACSLPAEEAKVYLAKFYDETWGFVLKLSPDYGPRLKAAADKYLQSGNR